MKASDAGNVERRRIEPDCAGALAPGEAVSALVDGELQDAALAAALQSLSHDAELRASWHAWHLAGDVLRSGEVAASGADPAFAARVMARLATETVPRPALPASSTPVALEKRANNAPVARVQATKSTQDAANSPVFRWKMVAGFATLVALGSVGWNLLDAARAPAGSAATLVQAQPPQLIRDPRLDELLAAHEQSGAVSALQMPAGFLRNATFEGRSR